MSEQCFGLNERYQSSYVMTTMSSVIGNIALLIRDFFYKTFPKDFFRNYFIDTRMMVLDMDKADIIKKNCPILILRPRFVLGDESLFGRLPDWMNTRSFIYRNMGLNYLNVLKDELNRTYIYTTVDRVRIDFEIEVVVKSRMQQLNLAYWWKYAYLHQNYFYLYGNVLESEIPKPFVKLIAERLGLNPKDREERLQLENYLTKYSQSRVIEKIKTSSGNPSWFFSYKTNFLCRTEDYPAIDDGRDMNMAHGFYKSTNTLSVELWIPTVFFLRILDKLYDSTAFETDEVIDNNSTQTVIYNYSRKANLPYEYGNKILEVAKGYINDSDNEPMVVEFGILFTTQLAEVYERMKQRNVDVSQYFELLIFHELLKIPADNYSVDWDKLVLTIPEPQNTTYTIALYVDRERINKFLYAIQLPVIYQK